MYWILLPTDANQKLHLESRRLSQTGGWSDAIHAFWKMVSHLLTSSRR